MAGHLFMCGMIRREHYPQRWMMEPEGTEVNWLTRVHTGIECRATLLISSPVPSPADHRESYPMLLPSGTEEPRPDIMGTRLLADDPGQEAMWLEELCCVGV